MDPITGKIPTNQPTNQPAQETGDAPPADAADATRGADDAVVDVLPSAPRADEAGALARGTARFAEIDSGIFARELPSVVTEYAAHQRVSDAFSDLGIAAVRGDASAIAVLERLAASDAAFAEGARMTLAEREALRHIMEAENPAEFGRRMMAYFNTTYMMIAREAMLGLEGRERAILFAKGMSQGPFTVLDHHIHRTFKGDPSPEAWRVRHDIVEKTVTAMFAIAQSEDASILRYLRSQEVRDDATPIVRDRVFHAVLPPSIHAARAGIALTVDVPGDLRYRDGIDPMQIDLVVGELVHNAVKYHRPEGGDRFIAVRWDAALSALVVEDNGTGIADTVRVWEKDFREAERHPGVEGTGMGLWSVRERLAVLGWAVALESEVGKGTRFIITPASGDVIGGEAPEGSSPSSPAAGAALIGGIIDLSGPDGDAASAAGDAAAQAPVQTAQPAIAGAAILTGSAAVTTVVVPAVGLPGGTTVR